MSTNNGNSTNASFWNRWWNIATDPKTLEYAKNAGIALYGIYITCDASVKAARVRNGEEKLGILNNALFQGARAALGGAMAAKGAVDIVQGLEQSAKERTQEIKK